MLLREFLNEFELDYAQAPTRVKKYPFGQLRDKEIVLVGDGNDTFTRSIIYSFLNLNDEKEVAKAFAKCYERCGSSSLNQRQKNATTAYNYFTN